jgi:methionine synthase II (cobalamin-independent)
MPKTKQKSVRISSSRSEDQPATRKMLSLVRDELSHKMESGFSDLKSEIHGIKSDVLRIEAGNSRMQLLLEEQNANNRIVLEGLQALWQRQDRIEERQGL